MNLLDRLKAWHSTPGSPGNAELKEMAQIGLRIITGYIKQQRSPVSFTRNNSSSSRASTLNISSWRRHRRVCDGTVCRINLKGDAVFVGADKQSQIKPV